MGQTLFFLVSRKKHFKNWIQVCEGHTHTEYSINKGALFHEIMKQRSLYTGLAGFEPADTGIRIQGLTIWR